MILFQSVVTLPVSSNIISNEEKEIDRKTWSRQKDPGSKMRIATRSSLLVETCEIPWFDLITTLERGHLKGKSVDGFLLATCGKVSLKWFTRIHEYP
jgi:hypothetical protein